MKIIEAMNKLKTLDKRLESNQEHIQEYCAKSSSEKSSFGSDEDQTKEITKTIQSSEDMIEEQATIKARLDFTNLVTSVPVNGKKFTLHKLLRLKRELLGKSMNIYTSLNDKKARRVVESQISVGSRGSSNKETTIHVIQHFDVKKKKEKLDQLSDMQDSIDSALQMAAATTDLRDLPQAS